jgi:Outer membrane protein beta-barrel domain
MPCLRKTDASERRARRSVVKSAVIAAVVIVGFATTAAAQSMTAGVKVGYNNSKVEFSEDEADDELEARTRPGLVVGLFTSFTVNPRFAFQPEFLYSQKGSTLRDDLGDEADLKLDYFEIPLLADIRLTEGTNRLSLMVGPTIGFRTKAEIEFDGETDDLTDEGDNEVEKTDFGITAGLAFTMNQFVIDGRYTWGLKDISKEADEAKNRTFSVSVGWRFR